jgi:large subunit ribosomal protein L25
MKAQTPVLQAKPRERLGSRYSERVRKAGGLPAVVYGHGEAPVSISIDAREALTHFHAGEKVYTLSMAGAKDQTVLLKDLQFDYLGNNVVHADFARVDLNEKVRTKVPVHLIGEAIGLKQAGAILMHPCNELVLECKVSEIPDFIEVTVTDLDVDQSITASQVALPADMKLITDGHAIVAQVTIQQEIKVGEATAATPGASAEPEVLTAKKAEGDAAKPAAGAAKPAAGAAAKPAAPKK